MTFAGLISFDGRPLGIRVEQQVAAAVSGPRHDRVSCLRTATGIIGQSGLSGARPGRVFAEQNRDDIFAADARIDNRAEMRALLGVYHGTDDAALLRLAVTRRRDADLARCVGAFAFVLWQPAARRLLLGRDCLGQRALFYHCGDGFVAFATSLRSLLALPQVPRELDEMALAHFLAINLNARQETFYRGIVRVPPRCVVELEPARCSERVYWSPAVGAPRRRASEYIEEARTLFDQAVAAVTADQPRIAIACSGGLDSSAIAATAARAGRAVPISCYSMVPPSGTALDVGPSHYLDESDKLKALGALYPALDMHLLPADAAHDDNLPRYFARACVPALGPTTLSLHAPLRDAVSAAGFSALLVGSLGNLGLTWSGAFSLRALLVERHLGTFLRELSAIAGQRGTSRFKAFLSDVVLPGAPIWARRLGHRLRGRDPADIARYSALNPAFMAEHDLPRRWLRDGFDPWPIAAGWDVQRLRTHLIFDANQTGRDLRAATMDAFGFETRDPFADRRLAEFALNVPEQLYCHNGVPRSFARAAFADRLPPEILNERRRGAVAPTWFRHLDARRGEIAADVAWLDSSPLVRRLIDVERLKRLVAQWPASEQDAQARRGDYRAALTRGLHVGRFIKWVEGGNA